MADAAVPFVPGAYWTRERARDAVRAMAEIRDSPGLQRMMEAVAAAGAAEAEPAAAVAALVGQAARPLDGGAPVRREACAFRRGRRDDVPALIPLIVAGELPPLFLEPFIDGFLVIEHEGRPVGAGGLELYGDDAVIRSVVVDPAARGLGLGLEIARLLEEDALASGARDIYLFTMQAWGFWLRLGYADTPLSAWPEPVRENWQYQFITRFPEAARDVHSMVKRRVDRV
jgi:N-acetylglutamate synthase-like GNAT family acetyltransferase